MVVVLVLEVAAVTAVRRGASVPLPPAPAVTVVEEGSAAEEVSGAVAAAAAAVAGRKTRSTRWMTL
jgi:hypothetical protein